MVLELLTEQSNPNSSKGLVQGRRKEIYEVEEALSNPEIQVVMITGFGGIGKTSLARAITERQAKNFSNRIVWIDGKSEKTLLQILVVIGSAIGIDAESFSVSEFRREINFLLRSQPYLLIFDDYEFLSDNDEVLSFIGRLPQPTKVLILSRARVSIPVRTSYIYLSGLSEDETLKLLRNTLSKELWDKLDEHEKHVIFAYSNGHPLTIHLIAALLQQNRPLSSILSNVDLDPGDNIYNLLDRVIEELTPDQYKFLEAMSVFAYPVNEEAITFVAEVNDWFSIGRELIDKRAINIVRHQRYAMHPIIRNYFMGRVQANRLPNLQRRMTHYFLEHTGRFKDDFIRLEEEWLNIQYAVETAFNIDQKDIFLQIVLNLVQFLDASGHAVEYQKWLRQALEFNEEPGNEYTRSVLTHNLGVFYQRQGDLHSAIELYQQSLDNLAKIDDPAVRSGILTNIGSAYREVNHIEKSIELYEEALRLSREVGDVAGEAQTLTNLGSSYADIRDFEKAVEAYNKALILSKKINNLQLSGNILVNLGNVYLSLRDLPKAVEYYQQSLRISRELGDYRAEISALNSLGRSYVFLLGYSKAREYYQQALDISQKIGDSRSQISVLNNLGQVNVILKRLAEAKKYYERALEIGEGLMDYRSITTTINNLGRVLGELGEYEKAIDYYKHSLAINESSGNPRNIITTYINLGELYSNIASTTNDTQYLKESIDLYNSALTLLSANDVEYSLISALIGHNYLSFFKDGQENVEKAIHHLNLSRNSGTNVDREYVVLYDLATAYLRRAKGSHKENVERAILYYKEALTFLTAEDNVREWLRTNVALCEAYVASKDWSKARELSNQILQTTQNTLNVYSYQEDLLPLYERLGDLALSNNDFETAARIFAEIVYFFETQQKSLSEAIAKKIESVKASLGQDAFSLIYAERQGILPPLLALELIEARRLIDSEQFKEATGKLTSALRQFNEMEEAQSLQYQKATLFFLRGFCLREQGIWEEAMSDQEKAFKLFEELGKFSDEARTLVEMGHLFEVMNNYEDARISYIDAYRLYKRVKEDNGMAYSSEHLGRLEYRVRLLPQALENLEIARNLYLSLGLKAKASSLENDISDVKSSLAHEKARKN